MSKIGAQWRVFPSIVLVVAMVSSISGVTAFLTPTPQQAFAEKDKGKDEKKLSDFDIKKVGINKQGNPFVKVKGEAGRTTPPNTASDFELVYTYVVFTDNGVWAINAHGFSHGGTSGGEKWHNEQITFDNDGNPQCIATARDAGDFVFDGHNVIFTGTGATKVYRAMTMSLEHIAQPNCIAQTLKILDQENVAAGHERDNDNEQD